MKTFTQLISNFHRVLGNFPASKYYMPTFRNTLSVPPMKMEQTECSERWHVKFRRLGITQKKAYTIHSTGLRSLLIRVWVRNC